MVNEIITAWNDFYAPSELELLADNSYDYVSGPSMTWSENYQYLTVKYSSYIDLFYIDGLTSLDWTGSRIGVKDQDSFSHARLWNPTSVPEPATMLLLGTALIGLAGLRRRFKK